MGANFFKAQVLMSSWAVLKSQRIGDEIVKFLLKNVPTGSPCIPIPIWVAEVDRQRGWEHPKTGGTSDHWPGRKRSGETSRFCEYDKPLALPSHKTLRRDNCRYVCRYYANVDMPNMGANSPFVPIAFILWRYLLPVLKYIVMSKKTLVFERSQFN